MYNRETKYKTAIQVDLKCDHFCRLTEKGTHGIPDSVIPEPLLRNKHVSCLVLDQNKTTIQNITFQNKSKKSKRTFSRGAAGYIEELPKIRFLD